MEAYIEGLLAELDMHRRAGRKERAEQVEAELARVGHPLDGAKQTAEAPKAPERAIRK